MKDEGSKLHAVFVCNESQLTSEVRQNLFVSFKSSE